MTLHEEPPSDAGMSPGPERAGWLYQPGPLFVLAASLFGTQGTVSLGAHLHFPNCIFFLVGCGEILCHQSPNEPEPKLRGGGDVVKSLQR